MNIDLDGKFVDCNAILLTEIFGVPLIKMTCQGCGNVELKPIQFDFLDEDEDE